ncbi:hypothetical protein MHYP_G00194390 [Metynnis hypsauchen]
MAAPRDPVKELDNKFGPGKWQWKPLKDQVKALVATVGDWGTKGTEIEKKVRLKFESWVKEHHGAEDRDKVSLAEFLNCMIKDKVEAVKKAQKEMGKVGIIKKSSAKGKLRAAEGDVAELRMLKVAFLGILTEMVTQRKEEVSSAAASTSDTSEKEVTQPRPKQEEAAGLAPPPPYNPEFSPHNPLLEISKYTQAQDARSVCKMLINHWIPQHGFPRKIHSDNGTHFTSKTLQWVEQALGLRHSYGSVYRPTSQGQVRSKGEPETDAPTEVALSEWVYLKVIKRKWCEPR